MASLGEPVPAADEAPITRRVPVPEVVRIPIDVDLSELDQGPITRRAGEITHAVEWHGTVDA